MKYKRIPLTLKKMKQIAITGCALGDYLVFAICYFTFSSSTFMNSILSTFLEANRIDRAYVAEQDILSFFQLFANVTLTALILMIIFHCIIYILAYKDKAAARGYLFALSGLGAIGMGFSGLFELFQLNAMAIPFLSQAILYGISFKYLKNSAKLLESKNETD
ncbi:MAG: hypothetical protein KAG61_09295 [Bacteriovoracaceae bacterium]|nr:hypothetical protein [Bacteriovoracaceae bacterium]